MPDAVIAREPTYHGNDEWCSVCGDDNIVLIIQGQQNCNTCSNQVNLCSRCCGIMKRQLNSINDGLDIEVK